MDILLFALIGGMAQLVDGSIGMAFGAIATSALILAGTSATVASAAVNLAKSGTGLASAISHWKLGNIHGPTVSWLAVPGGLAAYFSAHFLGTQSSHQVAPLSASVLFLLGGLILFRNTRLPHASTARASMRDSRRVLSVLAVVAGVLNSTGGGGWGPVTVPTLIARRRLSPRFVIGSANTAEFFVATSASIGFIVGMDTGRGVRDPVIGLLIGGAALAPVSALIVSRLPVHFLKFAAGAAVLLVNALVLIQLSIGLLVSSVTLLVIIGVFMGRCSGRGLLSGGRDGPEVLMRDDEAPDRQE